MGTIVSIEVVADAGDPGEAVERAFDWFHRIENCCSRFEPESELMQLTHQIGMPVPASAILFEVVQFALAVAKECGGAFDPTIGLSMERRGFNREHRTGTIIRTAIDSDDTVSYRDVRLDPAHRTITLLRPMVLDLGAVAKGFAIDMAARELAHFADFAVDAGGDLYMGGHNRTGEPWSIGIRHPRHEDSVIESIRVSNQAVCTSGDYERGLHILDPKTRSSATTAASVTVLAPTAMLADALATAAFVLGPAKGIELLERLEVDGLIFTPELDRFATLGMRS